MAGRAKREPPGLSPSMKTVHRRHTVVPGWGGGAAETGASAEGWDHAAWRARRYQPCSVRGGSSGSWRATVLRTRSGVLPAALPAVASPWSTSARRLTAGAPLPSRRGLFSLHAREGRTRSWFPFSWRGQQYMTTALPRGCIDYAALSQAGTSSSPCTRRHAGPSRR